MSKYLDLGGLSHLSEYLQTDDVTIERAANGSLKLSTGQTVWYGHRADWEVLSPTEKAKYGIVIFDDDGTLDFLIEYQGIQHYEPTRFGGISEAAANKQFKYIQTLDKRKRELCI